MFLISGMIKWKVILKEKLQGQRQNTVPLTENDVDLLHRGKKATKKYLNTKSTPRKNHYNSA